jgi:hypothetical protein
MRPSAATSVVTSFSWEQAGQVVQDRPSPTPKAPHSRKMKRKRKQMTTRRCAGKRRSKRGGVTLCGGGG